MLALYPGGITALKIKRGLLVAASVGAIALGLNEIELAWYIDAGPNSDIAQPAGDDYRRNGTIPANGDDSVPAANRDAKGNPISMAGDSTQYSLVLQTPDDLSQRTLAWDPIGAGITFIGMDGATVNSTTATSVTFTPSFTSPTGGQALKFKFSIPGGGGGLENLRCPKIGAVGTLATNYGAYHGAFIAANATDRYVKHTSVECLPVAFYLTNPFGDANTISSLASIGGTTFGAVVNGDGQWLKPFFTDTVRNRTSCSAGYLDGRRVEDIFAEAKAKNRSPHINLPWNCTVAYLTEVANQAVAFVLDTGLSVTVERGNEVWNFGYPNTHQCANEAARLGITHVQRYADKAKEAFDIFAAAFSAAGIRSKLKNTLCWQTAQGPVSDFGPMLARIATPGLVNKLMVAPYFGDNQAGLPMQVAGFGSGYTGAVAPASAACQTDLDRVLDQCVPHYNVALANNLEFGFYEFGLTPTFTDFAFRLAFNRDAGMFDLYMRAFQEARRRFPGAYINTFAYGYPISAADNFAWGLLEGNQRALDLANSPKGWAQKQYNLGKRLFFAATINAVAGVRADSGAGTVAATLDKYLADATISIVDPSNTYVYDPASKSIKLNAGVLTAATRNVDIVQTFANALNGVGGTFTTTVSLTLDPAITKLSTLVDNDNDNISDASLWVDNQPAWIGAAINGVGGAVTEAGAVCQVAIGTNLNGLFYSGRRSKNFYDFTNDSFFVSQVSGNAGWSGSEQFGIFIGPDALNGYLLNYFSGGLTLEEYQAGVRTQTSTSFAYSAANTFRFKFVQNGANIELWTATNASANPPTGPQWTLQKILAWDSVHIPLSLVKVCMFAGSFGMVAAPHTVSFDGINGAT